MNKLLNSELDAAIAIQCGWRKKTGYIDANGKTKGEWVGPDGYTYDDPPYYSTNLNDMYDAENELIGEQWVKYVNLLVELTSYQKGPCHATARQRAEAFLRTIGKWKENNA